MPEPSRPDVVEERSSWHLMTARARFETVVIWAVFGLYVTFALKLLLFSRPLGSERSFNLIPFASISHYLFGESSGVKRFASSNVAGNVLLFIPLGAYLSVLPKSPVARAMLIVASASVAVETLQGVFALGASDVDDVILNCLGGFVGIQVLLLLGALLRNRGGVRAVVAALSVLAVPVLAYLLFVIRLRL